MSGYANASAFPQLNVALPLHGMPKEPQHNESESILENVQMTEVANAIEGAKMPQSRGQSGTSFHFPLENVIDIVEHNEIDTLGLVHHREKNTSVLEPVKLLNTSGVITSPGVSTNTSSLRETTSETQQVQQPSMCPQFYKMILI